MKRAAAIMLVVAISVACMFTTVAYAKSNTTITLSDSAVKVDGSAISEKSTDTVYLSGSTDNGGSSSDSTDANIKVDHVITITEAGTYEFSGTLSDGQIAVDANKIDGDVNIILNNANITCKDAPAIFVYSKSIENEKCKVTIATRANTTNTITGGKIKQDTQGWSDQNDVVYYVEKGNDDDGTYYERYKYDGAISSDISLTFSGDGTLNVVGKKKEGIESKMNLTFNGGTINITSQDDGINASADHKSVITVNSGNILVKVDSEAEEGDGIDSNGSLIINDGTVYAFAHPGQDNGLDADDGIYINGGTVFATGDMGEGVQSQNDTKIVSMSLNSAVSSGETLLITNSSDEALFAYKTDRDYSSIIYSSPAIQNTECTVYKGTDVEGTIGKDNVYTKITSFDTSKLTKLEGSSRGMGPGGNGGQGQMGDGQMGGGPMGMQRDYTTPIVVISIILGALVAMIIAAIIIYVVISKKNKTKTTNK